MSNCLEVHVIMDSKEHWKPLAMDNPRGSNYEKKPSVEGLDIFSIFNFYFYCIRSNSKGKSKRNG